MRALPQLELANLHQKGDLLRLWSMASQTDLTVNLVRPGSGRDGDGTGTGVAGRP